MSRTYGRPAMSEHAPATGRRSKTRRAGIIPVVRGCWAVGDQIDRTGERSRWAAASSVRRRHAAGTSSSPPPELRDAGVVKPRTRLFYRWCRRCGHDRQRHPTLLDAGSVRSCRCRRSSSGSDPRSSRCTRDCCSSRSVRSSCMARRNSRLARRLLGIAAHAASVAGLVAVYRTARSAGDVLEAALVEALGSDYRSRVAEPFTPRPEATLTSRQQVAPEMPPGGGTDRRVRRLRRLRHA